MDKKEIRNYVQSIEVDEQASNEIVETVLNMDLYKEAHSIFIYVSMDNEPNTISIIKDALDKHKFVYVPKCISKTKMVAIQIQTIDDLVPQTMGILEPKQNEPTSNHFDLGIIPCVSANQKGARLGHGAGFYDRFFEKSTMKKMCLCFEERMFEHIPMDKNDKYMDIVVTEKSIYIRK